MTARRHPRDSDMDNVISWVTFIGALASVIAAVAWIERHPRKWRYAVPPALWSLHCVLFSAAYLMSDRLPLLWFVDFWTWGWILRIQAVATMFAYFIVVEYREAP